MPVNDRPVGIIDIRDFFDHWGPREFIFKINSVSFRANSPLSNEMGENNPVLNTLEDNGDINLFYFVYGLVHLIIKVSS